MDIGFFTAMDLLGTAAFSISGVLAARQKNPDVFGIFAIAFFTAIAGASIRSQLA